jgi:D-alanyl-D-alanine carboxypeptidase
MQKILDKGIEKHGAKGVSAAVIFPDDHIWTGVSGISHDHMAIRPDMVFAIGSATKNIVAALTIQLAEEKIIDLNDPLSIWLPEYPYINPDITIRQLLNHTSGIYMFWENDDLWKDLQKSREKYFTPEEVLSYLKEPDFAPGEGWRYSNTNYLLLGMIIEKATGSTLSEEFRKRFWKPLGIRNVWLSQQDGVPVDHMAHIYGDDNMFGQGDSDLTYEPRVSHESITFGSSGIFISAQDLARWCNALFEGKVLKPSSINEMLQFEAFAPVSNMRAYGLGVQKFRKNLSEGKLAIGHAGGNIGSTTYMMHLPDYHVSVVVMVNAFPNQGAEYIAKGLIRVVLKDIGAIGFIPYIPLFPTGIFIISIIIISVSLTRKMWKRQSQQSKSKKPFAQRT